MNDVTQVKSLENKKIFWAAKALIGGVLGATVYLLTAKIIVDQTYSGCYPEFSRSVVEGSKFLPWVLVSSIMRSESRLYQPVQYLLASIPYAVLGAFIASSSKRIVILIVACLAFVFLCTSWLLYAFFMSSMCA
jgi:hypothetical protein